MCAMEYRTNSYCRAFMRSSQMSSACKRRWQSKGYLIALLALILLKKRDVTVNLKRVQIDRNIGRDRNIDYVAKSTGLHGA
jgi:hypothetical protein